MNLKRPLRKGYKPPSNLLSKLQVLNLEEIINLPNLEIDRLFRPEGLPSVDNLAITTTEKTTVEELITASQWLKNLRLCLWQLPPQQQEGHSPKTPTDEATYKRLFSSLKGAKLKELSIHGGLYNCCGWEALEILAPIAHHMPKIRRLVFSGATKHGYYGKVPTEEARELKRKLKGTFPRLEELHVGWVAARVLKDLWPLATVS